MNLRNDTKCGQPNALLIKGFPERWHALLTGSIQNYVMGRIKRLLQKDHTTVTPSELICPLCERRIPDSQRDAHHLVPKSKGGRRTEYLHRICHRQIHALVTETELARQFNSVAALLTHPEVALFLAWVSTKPEDFVERTRKSQRLRSRH